MTQVNVILTCPACGAETVRENFAARETVEEIQERLENGEIPGWICSTCGDAHLDVAISA